MTDNSALFCTSKDIEVMTEFLRSTDCHQFLSMNYLGKYVGLEVGRCPDRVDTYFISQVIRHYASVCVSLSEVKGNQLGDCNQKSHLILMIYYSNDTLKNEVAQLNPPTDKQRDGGTDRWIEGRADAQKAGRSSTKRFSPSCSQDRQKKT